MEVNRGVWSSDEHDRFLEAMQIYPHGPWRLVASHVGTRDSRQVQTHAQKYFEKIGRHIRGLRKERHGWVRAEHRIEGLPPALQHQIMRPSAQPRIQAWSAQSHTPTHKQRDMEERGQEALALETKPSRATLMQTNEEDGPD